MMVYHEKILMEIMMEIILFRLDGYFNPYVCYKWKIPIQPAKGGELFCGLP